MKKTLEKAVKANDIPQVRTILLQMLSSKSDNTASLKDITEVIKKTPKLFDKDDGKVYGPTAEEMTETQVEALREDIVSNFSVHKFSRLAEVREIERKNPRYYRDRVKEVAESVDYPDGEVSVSEEIVDDSVVAAEAVEPSVDEPSIVDIVAEKVDAVCPDDCAVQEVAEESITTEQPEASTASGEKKPCAVGRTFGYVILLLGLAAAITGVCVPVKFLIGLGIGVLMLGAAIVYASISRSSQD